MAMMPTDALDRGRASFERRAWAEAYTHLSAAHSETPLASQDLERLAIAAHLVGRDDACAEAWTRAHQEYLRLRDLAGAARCAYWLATSHFTRGEAAHGSGWVARAQRLLDDGHVDCVERGYLLMPLARRHLVAGDYAAALATANQAGAVAERFRDPDLIALSRLGRGRALIYLGQISQGMQLLDEAMVAVTAGEVSPVPAGIVYCSVIDACQETFDLHRAREWTAALTRWCDSQPDLVPYRGECLVYRAEILRLHGAWSDAAVEAQRACEWLSQPPGPVTGAAFYQRAEIHRLRGEFAKAEAAYRRASRFGRTPQPGLALLRLARGQLDIAAAAIRRVVAESQDRVSRSKVLTAHVEIMLAVGDLASARCGADELSQIAVEINTSSLLAGAAQAQGAILLAEGDAHAAVDALRFAWSVWQDLEAPFEAAQVRVLRGRAYSALGDRDSAAMELDAARMVFRRVGALPDAMRVEALALTTPARAAGALTARDLAVALARGDGQEQPRDRRRPVP